MVAPDWPEVASPLVDPFFRRVSFSASSCGRLQSSRFPPPSPFVSGEFLTASFSLRRTELMVTVAPLRPGFQIRPSSPPEPPDRAPSISHRPLLLVPVQPRPLHPPEPPDPPDPPNRRAPTPLPCSVSPPNSQALSNPRTPSTIPDLLLTRSATAVLTRLDPPPRLTLVVVRLAGFCSIELALFASHCPLHSRTRSPPQPRFSPATSPPERSHQETIASVFADQACNSDDSSLISPISHIVGFHELTYAVLEYCQLTGVSPNLLISSQGTELEVAAYGHNPPPTARRSSTGVVFNFPTSQAAESPWVNDLLSTHGMELEVAAYGDNPPPIARRSSTGFVFNFQTSQAAESPNSPLSSTRNVFKRSALTRAFSVVHLLSIAKELQIAFETIISEALLKKLQVFVFDSNCLTYPFNALFFISVPSSSYSLAKSHLLLL